MSSDEEPLTAELFEDSGAQKPDPFALFAEWLATARASELNDANAMALASVDENGLPDVRMVLLNALDERGFVFFTNFESAKGTQLLVQPQAALLFHWKSLRRQIRIRGKVEVTAADEADAYFATRPAQSRLGAHASDQSRPLKSRQALVERVQAMRARFGESVIPRPAHWSGFRVKAQTIEFWKDGAFRLHDRFLYTRLPGEGWSVSRLYP